MKNHETHRDIKKFSPAGALIALGIVFGDLATSPLFTMRAIIAGSPETII